MKVQLAGWFFSLTVVLLVSCNRNKPDSVFGTSIKYPKENPQTAEKIELGRRLFFDPILSLDSSVSCASCHKPKFAFADTVSVSPGVKGRIGFRNAPTLLNTAHYPHFMSEGGVKSLELQVLAPLEDHNEMSMPVFEACERLNGIAEYQRMFKLVWNDSATPFTLTRSIAAFERTLLSSGSRYDRYAKGDIAALTNLERIGLELFESNRLQCAQCHSGVLFTSLGFENNGLDSVYEDNGRFRLTVDTNDLGKFKVPSLRNIALTSPYMHDGRFQSLGEVIDHYDLGGTGHVNQSDKVKPLRLKDAEKKALESFLMSLTDTALIR
ncbi:MAG: cytochrome-c peroxidase [Salibacteraceae bacterium]